MNVIKEPEFLTDVDIIRNLSVNESAARAYMAQGKLFTGNEGVDFEDFLSSLTPARQNLIISAIELYKRAQRRREQAPTIHSSATIYDIMEPILGDKTHEEFYILLLNQANKLIKKVRISTGGIDQTTADVRIILREAILAKATQIVAIHNHPSGNVRPSQEDKRLTQTLKKGAEVMNLRLTDHVIITAGAFFSFNDEGLL